MRGSSSSRLRTTPRIRATSGDSFEQVRQQPPRQRPLAVELARRRGLAAARTRPRSSTARCSFRVGFFVFSAFFALSRPGSLVFSGIWSYFSFQRRMLDVVLVGQGEDVALGRRTAAGRRGRRSGGPCSASISFSLPNGPFTRRRQHDRAGRQVDARRPASRCRRATRQQLLLEQVLDDAAVLRQQPGVVDADAAAQHLLQLRPDALRPVELVDLGVAAAVCCRRPAAGRGP